MTNEDEFNEVDQHFENLLRYVISQSWPRSAENAVAGALVLLLSRVANTWTSMRTLVQHSPHQELLVVDAGTLLRAMFDAYLQAEYIATDEHEAVRRAQDYLDFEYVERKKWYEKIHKYDYEGARRLRESPEVKEIRPSIQEQYDRVKSRFPSKGRWHQPNLRKIAELLDKEDEYDLLLAMLHGCVHSSASALQKGGVPISAKNALTWASTVAARVAKLNVDHHRLELGGQHKAVLHAWCRPYFGKVAS